MLAFPLLWILANRRSIFARTRLADGLGRAVRDHRRPAVRGVLGPVSLTLVLPAFNEAERIGPALDELFGYLRRRSDRGSRRSARSRGSPGADRGPRRRRRQHGRRPPTSSRHDPRRRAPSPACGCTSGASPTAARAPRSVPACSRPPATWWSSPTPTWRRRPTRSRCSSRRWPTTTSRSARGSSPTARTCARPSRATAACSARCFHVLASIWVVGPVQDTQCGFKGFRREAAQDLFARQRVTSIVFDVELIYLARRRGYRMAVVPIRWFDKRGSRMRAGRGPGDPRRLGPVPDPAHPSRQPPERHGTGVMDRDALARLARTALPILAVLSFVGGVGADPGRRGRHARLRLPGLPPGRRAGDRRRAAVRHVVHGDRRLRAVLLSADRSRRLLLPFALLSADDRDLGLDRPVAGRLPRRRRDPAGLAVGALVDRAARRPVVPVRLRASSSGRSGRSCSCAFAIGWRWHRRPDAPRVPAPRSGPPSSCSRASSSCGRS